MSKKSLCHFLRETQTKGNAQPATPFNSAPFKRITMAKNVPPSTCSFPLQCLLNAESWLLQTMSTLRLRLVQVYSLTPNSSKSFHCFQIFTSTMSCDTKFSLLEYLYLTHEVSQTIILTCWVSVLIELETFSSDFKSY